MASHQCFFSGDQIFIDNDKVYNGNEAGVINPTAGHGQCSTVQETSSLNSDEDDSGTPSTSTGAKKASWSDSETKCLMAAYVNNKENVLSSMFNKKQVWQKISKELIQSGVYKSAKTCDEKWRNLKKMYEKIENNLKTTGAKKSHRIFYEDLKEIFFHDAKFNPVFTQSSTGRIVSNIGQAKDDTQTGETTPVSKKKFSPNEIPRRTLSSYEIEIKKQKRHEDKMKLKRKMFKWFQENFTKIGKEGASYSDSD